MTFGEAWRLLHMLLADPSSWVTAAVTGWDYPVTRADLTMRELYDLQHTSKAKRKPAPFPRPWDKQPQRVGAGTSLTIAEFRAIKERLRASTDPNHQPRNALGQFASKTKAVPNG